MEKTYADFVKHTSTYPNQGQNILYPLLGLSSEVGEVAEKILNALSEGKINIKVANPSDISAALCMMVILGNNTSTLKKAQRDKNESVTYTTIISMDLHPVCKELGDCQWYLEALSQELGSTGEKDRAENVEKLTGRLERGTVKGNGDDR